MLLYASQLVLECLYLIYTYPNLLSINIKKA